MKFSSAPAKLALQFSLLFSLSAHAFYIFDGKSLQPADLFDISQDIQKSDIVVIGEQHDSSVHHELELDLLGYFSRFHTKKLHLGMEFIAYDEQTSLDMYLRNEISEEEFLSDIQWNGVPFSEYREQIRDPLILGGWTYGLNLPRRVSKEIAKSGIANLPPELAALLPPNPEKGNLSYFERFAETMKGHVPEESIERYFQAQSMWDDTMAWKAVELIRPDEMFLAIIVGDFHVAYGGGLPDRIRARGDHKTHMTTVSLISECSELAVDPKYGVRADYLVSAIPCERSMP